MDQMVNQRSFKSEQSELKYSSFIMHDAILYCDILSYLQIFYELLFSSDLISNKTYLLTEQCNPALTLSILLQCNVECHLKQAFTGVSEAVKKKAEKKIRVRGGVHPESLFEISLQ